MKNKTAVINIRNRVGYLPYWIIIRLLEMNDYDEDKTVEVIRDRFCAIGDHPEVVLNVKLRGY